MRGFAVIEITSSEPSDAIECKRQLGLPEGLLPVVVRATFEENAFRLGELGKQRSVVLPGVHLGKGDRETVGCEVYCRLHQFSPRLPPVPFVSQFQTSNGPG